MMIPLLWLAVGSVIFALIAWTNRSAAFALLIVFLPAYQLRFALFGIPGTVLEAMILILFAVTMIQNRKVAMSELQRDITALKKDPREWLKSPKGIAFITMLSFLVVALAGLAVTPDLRAGLGLFKAYVIEPMLLVVLVPYIFLYARDTRRALGAAVVSAIGVSVIALFQYISGWGIPDPWQAEATRRAVSVFTYPNAVGLYLAPLAAVFIAAIVHGKTLFESRAQHVKWQGSLMLATVLSFGAMVTSRSDGAIVAIAAATIVTLFFTRLRWFVVVASGIVLGAALLVDATRQILFFQDISGDVRRALWHGTLNLIGHRPLQGAGLGGFPEVYNIYRLPSHVELLEYSHNVFLDFWTQFGFFGFVWLVVVLGLGIYSALIARKVTKSRSMISLSMVTAFVVYGMVDVPYFKNDLAVLSWFMFASMLWCYAEYKEAQAPLITEE